MRRVIVDYAKLINDILSLLVDKFPDGYEEYDIIRFKNAQNELIEAVEVRTEDTIYLVKVSKKLVSRMDNFEEEDDDIASVDVIAPVKDIDLEDNEEEETEEDESKSTREEEDGEEDEDFDQEEPIEEEDEEDDY